MLRALTHQDFKKDYRKQRSAIHDAFSTRLLLFLKNPANQLLRDHSLTGNLRGKRAFSISGDVRVVYRYIDKNTVILLRIGGHNQVY